MADQTCPVILIVGLNYLLLGMSLIGSLLECIMSGCIFCTAAPAFFVWCLAYYCWLCTTYAWASSISLTFFRQVLLPFPSMPLPSTQVAGLTYFVLLMPTLLPLSHPISEMYSPQLRFHIYANIFRRPQWRWLFLPLLSASSWTTFQLDVTRPVFFIWISGRNSFSVILSLMPGIYGSRTLWISVSFDTHCHHFSVCFNRFHYA